MSEYLFLRKTYIDDSTATARAKTRHRQARTVDKFPPHIKDMYVMAVIRYGLSQTPAQAVRNSCRPKIDIKIKTTKMRWALLEEF